MDISDQEIVAQKQRINSILILTTQPNWYVSLYI